MRLRTGFSLVEVVAALAVASIGLLALIGVDANAWRRRARADLAARAALAARSRAERLASLDCALATPGTADSPDGVHERWLVGHGPRALLLLSAVAAYETDMGRDSAVVHAARWCE